MCFVDHDSAVKTESDETSIEDASTVLGNLSAVSTELAASVKLEPTAPVMSEQQPAAATDSPAELAGKHEPPTITVGETVEKLLLLRKICKKLKEFVRLMNWINCVDCRCMFICDYN